MSERFTKGNWHTEQRAKGVIILADSENLNAGFSICSVNGPESEANAALIACAPEMYEMLKQVSQLIDNDGGAAIDWLIENTFDIRELLAKARGES